MKDAVFIMKVTERGVLLGTQDAGNLENVCNQTLLARTTSETV